jgi:arginine exporter protein ArgO
MKDLIKKEYKNLILIICYIIVAELVYIVLFNSFFKEKVWVTLLVAFGVFLLGCLFGFLYIKDDLKEKKEKEAQKIEEPKEVAVEENSLGNQDEEENNEAALVETQEESKEENTIEEEKKPE